MFLFCFFFFDVPRGGLLFVALLPFLLLFLRFLHDLPQVVCIPLRKQRWLRLLFHQVPPFFGVLARRVFPRCQLGFSRGVVRLEHRLSLPEHLLGRPVVGVPQAREHLEFIPLYDVSPGMTANVREGVRSRGASRISPFTLGLIFLTDLAFGLVHWRDIFGTLFTAGPEAYCVGAHRLQPEAIFGPW